MNHTLIIVAAVASFVLGMIWWGPLFGKAWMRGMGMKVETTKPPVSSMIATIISSLVKVYALAWMLSLTQMPNIEAVMMLFFAIWIGVLSNVELSGVLWSKRKIPVMLINMGFYAVEFALIAFIIA